MRDALSSRQGPRIPEMEAAPASPIRGNGGLDSASEEGGTSMRSGRTVVPRIRWEGTRWFSSIRGGTVVPSNSLGKKGVPVDSLGRKRWPRLRSEETVVPRIRSGRTVAHRLALGRKGGSLDSVGRTVVLDSAREETVVLDCRSGGDGGYRLRSGRNGGDLHFLVGRFNSLRGARRPEEVEVSGGDFSAAGGPERRPPRTGAGGTSAEDSTTRPHDARSSGQGFQLRQAG